MKMNLFKEISLLLRIYIKSKYTNNYICTRKKEIRMICYSELTNLPLALQILLFALYYLAFGFVPMQVNGKTCNANSKICNAID